jgi:hypothetical protein
LKKKIFFFKKNQLHFLKKFALIKSKHLVFFFFDMLKRKLASTSDEQIWKTAENASRESPITTEVIKSCEWPALVVEHVFSYADKLDWLSLACLNQRWFQCGRAVFRTPTICSKEERWDLTQAWFHVCRDTPPCQLFFKMVRDNLYHCLRRRRSYCPTREEHVKGVVDLARRELRYNDDGKISFQDYMFLLAARHSDVRCMRWLGDQFEISGDIVHSRGDQLSDALTVNRHARDVIPWVFRRYTKELSNNPWFTPAHWLSRALYRLHLPSLEGICELFSNIRYTDLTRVCPDIHHALCNSFTKNSVAVAKHMLTNFVWDRNDFCRWYDGKLIGDLSARGHVEMLGILWTHFDLSGAYLRTRHSECVNKILTFAITKLSAPLADRLKGFRWLDEQGGMQFSAEEMRRFMLDTELFEEAFQRKNTMYVRWLAERFNVTWTPEVRPHAIVYITHALRTQSFDLLHWLVDQSDWTSIECFIRAIDAEFSGKFPLLLSRSWAQRRCYTMAEKRKVEEFMLERFAYAMKIP